jgi:hypothetical protein
VTDASSVPVPRLSLSICPTVSPLPEEVPPKAGHVVIYENEVEGVESGGIPEPDEPKIGKILGRRGILSDQLQ